MVLNFSFPFCASGQFHMNLPAEILGDIVHLRISYQSSVIQLSDKHSCIDLMYLNFILCSYMFRLSTSAIVR
jgi:hypothetical protein